MTNMTPRKWWRLLFRDLPIEGTPDNYILLTSQAREPIGATPVYVFTEEELKRFTDYFWLKSIVETEMHIKHGKSKDMDYYWQQKFGGDENV